MSGERSARLIDLAARAAARSAKRLEMINDRYAPATPIQEARRLTLEEFMSHYDEFGHLAPGDGCDHPTCVKAAALIQSAIASIGQQGGNTQRS